jgi:hypothetical protein
VQPIEVFYLVEWLFFVGVGISLLVRPNWLFKLRRASRPVSEGRLRIVRVSGAVLIAMSLIGLVLLFTGESA